MSSASEAGAGPDDGGPLPAAGAGATDAVELLRMLRAMMLIRAFEECLLRQPRPGFQLLSSGEEAVAVGVCAALGPDDQLLSSGRSIGPALARGLDPRDVMAELLGKAAGPCKGKGGRGHLARPDAGFFGAHAVVAGNLAVAAGVALAAQLQRRPRVVACIFGDGACGAGALHETLNLAALWKLPLVFVCDNNQYSVSTPVREALAPARLADLAGPFGIPAQTVDGMDVVVVRDAARAMVGRARAGGGPSFLECLAYRFTTHSTSSRESRPEDEVRHWRERCPIRMLADRLGTSGLLDGQALERLRREAEDQAAAAAASAVAAPYPDPSEALADVE
jgi:TPP-dependent pyruvate/acetoin dehydrogenase alpha subunit